MHFQVFTNCFLLKNKITYLHIVEKFCHIKKNTDFCTRF